MAFIYYTKEDFEPIEEWTKEELYEELVDTFIHPLNQFMCTNEMRMEIIDLLEDNIKILTNILKENNIKIPKSVTKNEEKISEKCRKSIIELMKF